MNTTTLIIDGNWFLMSRVSVMLKDFNKEYSAVDLLEAQNKLCDFMAQSLHKIVGVLTFHDPNLIDNIILVQDGGSWRKTVPLPQTYHDDTYKGHRTKDQNVDWNYIWAAHDMFFDKCTEQGMSTFKASGVEGDDWVWWWTNTLGSQGVNTVIWTTDADLKQLVKFHPSGAWTVWFNENNGLCYPKRTLSELDMFMQDVSSYDFLLDNFINNTALMGYKTEPINNIDIIMYKIICGDTADNVKAVMRLKQGSRTSKVSEKEWQSVREKLHIETLKDFFDLREDIIWELRHLKRFTKCTDTEDMLLETFDYNKKMVYLHGSSYPIEVREAMHYQTQHYRQFDMEGFKNNYNILSPLKPVDELELFNGLDF